MQMRPINKKCYVATGCIPNPNKVEHFIRIQLERKYYGVKDEIFEVFNAA